MPISQVAYQRYIHTVRTQLSDAILASGRNSQPTKLNTADTYLTEAKKNVQEVEEKLKAIEITTQKSQRIAQRARRSQKRLTKINTQLRDETQGLTQSTPKRLIRKKPHTTTHQKRKNRVIERRMQIAFQRAQRFYKTFHELRQSL